MKQSTFKTLMTILFLLTINSATAADWPSGDEIAQKINARDEGTAVSRTLKMEMIDKHGKKRERLTRAMRKYYGDEKRSVIFYQSPKSIKDTAFLTYDYADPKRDDDQWLYLPAMRKVRRISASDRGDYFLGTDLTYDEIKLESRVAVADYNRKTVGEDNVDGHHCLLVENLPISDQVAEELGYSKVEQCVDDQIWIVRRAKAWDLRGNLLKTSHFKDIRQVQGIWTWHLIEVVNHKSNHRTRFIFSDVDYQSGVDDQLFTQNAIRRGI